MELRSLSAVRKEGDDRSVFAPIDARAGVVYALDITSTTARVSSLAAGWYIITVTGRDPSLKVGIKLGDNTVTSPALPTTGTSSTHHRVFTADIEERVYVGLQPDGTTVTAVAFITSSATAATAFLTLLENGP